MTFPAEERTGAWVNLFQATQVVENALERELKAGASISLAEFELLARLSSAPDGRLKMIEIANLLLHSKSGVTRIVDRLEQAGYVGRETPPENRRIVFASITPAGFEVLRRAKAVFERGLMQSFSRHLSDADVQALRRGLRKLLVGNGIWEEERCSLKLGEESLDAAKRTAVRR